MQTIAVRKEAKRLSFADGRYSTTGSPRSGGLASVWAARGTWKPMRCGSQALSY